MTDQELAALEDNELMRRIDESGEVEKTLKTMGWRLIEEKCRRIFVRADADLDVVDPSNYKKIAELQIMRKFYRNILPSIKSAFKQDGDMAFTIAKNRGLIQRAIDFLNREPTPSK